MNMLQMSCKLGMYGMDMPYAFLPKKSCFRACPIYCPVVNFTRHVFCLYVIAGLFPKSFDNILSTSLLSSHLCSWCVSWDHFLL